MEESNGWLIIGLLLISFYAGFIMGKKYTIFKVSRSLGERIGKINMIMEQRLR